MLRFIKRKSKVQPQTSQIDGDSAIATPDTASQAAETKAELPETVTQNNASTEDTPKSKPGFIKRLAGKISRTSNTLGNNLGKILLGKKEIDDELLEDIETQLLLADVGIDTTTAIMSKLADTIERQSLADSDALYQQLQSELKQVLGTGSQPFVIDCNHMPFVILVVGVNGAGKTTTIGKLAKRFQSEGLEVMLAAGDTYRAAAVEQLQVWGERNDVPVIAQHTGADSASVIFDALESAKSRSIDVLIADTAGRLHNKDNLMEELKKIVRVMGKIDVNAPQEILLVLDATTGQNAISQAQHFQDAVGVTGIAVTKLDGTAKGGVLFAISDRLKLPIRFIGVGEQVEDLRPFDAEEFVEAIFADASER